MPEARVNVGLERLRSALSAFRLSVRKAIVGKAVLAGARVLRDEARRLTPVLAAPIRRVRSSRRSNGATRSARGPSPGTVIRKPGTVRKAIVANRSETLTTATTVGARVKVRPARPGQVGTYSPNDPFYAVFLERGTKKMRAFAMLATAAARAGRQAVARIEEVAREEIERRWGK